jgi:hypothetical protein
MVDVGKKLFQIGPVCGNGVRRVTLFELKVANKTL